MESDAQSSYPGKLLDLAVDENILTHDQRDELWYDNVLRWLGAEEDIALRNRIGIE